MWKGSVGFTDSPSVELSIGMSLRQPRMFRPSCAATCSKVLRTISRRSASRGMNSTPIAVLAGRGQRDAERLGLAGEELVRDLHQDAGAVAGARIGADRAAMLEIAAGSCSASSTIWCDLRPLMSAMKPTPQESLSSAGS